MSCFSVQHCQITRWLVIVLTLIDALTAFRAFTNTSFTSTNLTVPCVGALSADIACCPAVSGLRLGEYYPEETLNRTCIILQVVDKRLRSMRTKMWQTNLERVRGHRDAYRRHARHAAVPLQLNLFNGLWPILQFSCGEDSSCTRLRRYWKAIWGVEQLSEIAWELTKGFKQQRVRAYFGDRWVLTTPPTLQMLPIPVICASSRIFNSRPAPHISTDLSFKSDRSISLKHQGAGLQATCWSRAPSLFTSMWGFFALFMLV